MNAHVSNDQAPDPATQQMVVRADYPSLVRQAEPPDHRVELYARLRTILETATESIRTLKEENAALQRANAEMSDQNSTLGQQLRAATVDLEREELALRESADLLDQLLRGDAASPQSVDGLNGSTTRSEVPEATQTDSTMITTEPWESPNPESAPLPRHSIFKWGER